MDIRSVYVYDFTEDDGLGTHIYKEMSSEELSGCEDLCQELNGEMNNQDRREVDRESVMFYCLKQDGRVFICIAGKDAKKRSAFGLLEACADDPDFDVDDESTSVKVFKKHMEHFNDPDNDDIIKCKTKIDEIKEIVIDNIDSVLENMEKVEDLLEDTKELEGSAKRFRRSGRSLERKQISKTVLIGAIIICICLCICLIILGVVIGGMTLVGLLVGVLVEIFEESKEKEEDGLLKFIFSILGL